MILPASKLRLIDHTVSLLEASHCIDVLVTGKFAQAVLHFFKVRVKQKLHWNMFRCLELWAASYRFYAKTDVFLDALLLLSNWALCYECDFVHGYVRYCDRVNKLQWLSSPFDLFLVILSFPFTYCNTQKKHYSLCSEAVSSRDLQSERHIFERRYATAFHFVVSGSEALYSAHSPVS